MDSVDDVLRELQAEELEQLRISMIQTLLMKKLLRSERLFGKWYLVGIDGTGVMSAKEGDEGTLRKESKNGKITFTRQVLEAKLIVPGGMALSIASEWIATSLDGNVSKEDCELNAFKRLAEKIKSFFPKLPFCILVDGLYPSTSFFTICRENDWRFCAVLKDKKLSTVWDQVDSVLLAAEATGHVKNMIFENNSVIEWVNGLNYRDFKVAWIECLEGSGEGQHRFVFLTDIPVERSKARELVAAGRSRWRLEDAFNTQKHRGYSLSHKYSRVSFLAAKNYYVLMQIAHIINQLLEFSQHMANLIDHSKETLRHLWRLLVAALAFVEDDAQLIPNARRTQYRLDFG
jgi:hypothetical protein